MALLPVSPGSSAPTAVPGLHGVPSTVLALPGPHVSSGATTAPGTVAPQGPRISASQNPHPSHPAALHRRNKREGGDIIQSRAEKCLNLISVGHGHNRISPVHWNIVSMFPQRRIIVLGKPALGAQVGKCAMGVGGGQELGW